MAAFPYHHPLLLDQSFFFPNPNPTTIAITNTTTTATAMATCFPEFHQPHDDHLFHDHQVMSMGSCTKMGHHNDQVSLANILPTSDFTTSSMVFDDQKVVSSKEKSANKRKHKTMHSLNHAQSKDETKEMRKKQKKKNDDQEKKKIEEEEGQKGYVHVRARRGQATDSHSLAERVRREKISKRMKVLQALVPGCDKVTGKILMLDEIINYVQSLQNEVEVLSMKLASVDSMFYEFGMDKLHKFAPDQNNNFQNNMSSMQPCNPTEEQEQMSNIHFQGNGELLWDMEDQRLEFDDLFAITNNLTSFY